MTKRGKLIVIEGTDCSGKETQTRMLVDRLRGEGVLVGTMSFPRYDTPTGRIVGGPYLGKPEIEGSWFPEGSAALDPKIASLYYAADRRAALNGMNQILDSGYHLILDRYVDANKGHQGGKLKNVSGREDIWRFIDCLEHDLLGLPRPDHTIFLYMPYQIGMKLRGSREGMADGHESDVDRLRNAEEAYLQLARISRWDQVNCVRDSNPWPPRSREEIHEEVYSKVLGSL